MSSIAHQLACTVASFSSIETLTLGDQDFVGIVHGKGDVVAFMTSDMVQMELSAPWKLWGCPPHFTYACAYYILFISLSIYLYMCVCGR